MKFLTKIGQIALTGLTYFAKFEGLIQTDVPSATGIIQTVSKDLSAIADIIVQVEIFGQAVNLPGSQKLIAAAPAVEQIILSSAMLSNHKINDEALFKQGVTKLTDGMADILNSLHVDVTTVSKS